MNKWFISGTHFSHANIIRYTGRPFQYAIKCIWIAVRSVTTASLRSHAHKVSIFLLLEWRIGVRRLNSSPKCLNAKPDPFRFTKPGPFIVYIWRKSSFLSCFRQFELLNWRKHGVNIDFSPV